MSNRIGPPKFLAAPPFVCGYFEPDCFKLVTVSFIKGISINQKIQYNKIPTVPQGKTMTNDLLGSGTCQPHINSHLKDKRYLT